MPDHDPDILTRVEETVTVSTRPVVTGRVRVRTETETEQTSVAADLEGESVEVTRVPIDREIDAAPAVRTEGDVTILPVVEEVLVVEKRLVLKEEIHIRRRATIETVEIPVTLRRQRAIVEHLEPGTATGDAEAILSDPNQISEDRS